MKTKSSSAFTFVELLLVLAVLGLLASIAIPNFIEGRSKAKKAECVHNLELIKYARDAYIVFANKPRQYQATFDELICPNGPLRQKPTCPNGGKYTINVVGVDPTCSTPGHAIPEPAELPRD